MKFNQVKGQQCYKGMLPAEPSHPLIDIKLILIGPCATHCSR